MTIKEIRERLADDYRTVPQPDVGLRLADARALLDVIETLWGHLAAARRYVHSYAEHEANHPQARDNANSLIHQIDTSIAKLK